MREVCMSVLINGTLSFMHVELSALPLTLQCFCLALQRQMPSVPEPKPNFSLSNKQNLVIH